MILNIVVLRSKGNTYCMYLTAITKVMLKGLVTHLSMSSFKYREK